MKRCRVSYFGMYKAFKCIAFSVITLLITLFLIPTTIHAGSHYGHFYFEPPSSPKQPRKVPPNGADVYVLLYVNIKFTSQHNYWGGKLDVTYPDANLDLVNAFPGVYFTNGITIRSIGRPVGDTNLNHKLVDFVANTPGNPSGDGGGKNKVALILHFKTKAASSTVQTITLNPVTTILYNTSLQKRGEPHSVLQPTWILVTSDETPSEPPIPTPMDTDAYDSTRPSTWFPTKTPCNVSYNPTPQCLTSGITGTPTPSPTPTTPAQATYTVTMETKNNTHPQFGQGSTLGYTIDGIQGKELTLIRGKSYEFDVTNIDMTGHPFYLSTSIIGHGAGIVNPDSFNDGILRFTPTSSTPDLIYYQCENHDRMGWKINIVNSLPSTTPTNSPTPQNSSPTPTPTPLPGNIVPPHNVVDIFDYNAVVTDFGLTGTNLRSDIALPKNNTVDIFDYNKVVSNFGSTQ